MKNNNITRGQRNGHTEKYFEKTRYIELFQASPMIREQHQIQKGDTHRYGSTGEEMRQQNSSREDPYGYVSQELTASQKQKLKQRLTTSSECMMRTKTHLDGNHRPTAFSWNVRGAIGTVVKGMIENLAGCICDALCLQELQTRWAETKLDQQVSRSTC